MVVVMAGQCEGRTALVTGASRGIGQAIAARLAAEGARVVVVARSLRPQDHPLAGSLEETVQTIRALGAEAYPLVADLSQPEPERGYIVEAAREALGADIDILVNNAAASFYIPFEDFSLRKARLIFEVNVGASWELMRAVIPAMKARKQGWIVNVSSAVVIPPVGPPYELSGNAMPGAAAYAGSKAWLNRMTQSVALETYEHRIAVNTVAPEAAVRTEGATALVELADEVCEPLETVAEAALALSTCDPETLTGRTTYSLSLLKELGRPVHSLDGKQLVQGWQPEEIPDIHLHSQRWMEAGS
jgi:NAD(P)-dependent dehydrogenase (short-subunit alcohol dehydrogenase family)